MTKLLTMYATELDMCYIVWDICYIVWDICYTVWDISS